MSKTTLTISPLTLSSNTINASVTSAIIDKNQLDLFTFQPIWSGGGTPAGNFQIFGSDDLANLANVGKTTAITNGTQIGADVAIAGNSGSNLLPSPTTAINSPQSYRFVQFKYNFTSGTATLNAHFHGMGCT